MRRDGREATAVARVILHILRRHEAVPEGALEFIVDATLDQSAFQAHLAKGRPLDVDAVIAGVRASLIGRFVLGGGDAEPRRDPEETSKPTPARRMTEARRRGPT